MKKFTTRDGLPFTFELARTEMPVGDRSHLGRYWLFTLVDIHLGVVIDATVGNPAMCYPPEDGSIWELLDFIGEDTELLTISIPDASVLSDDELAALPWAWVPQLWVGLVTGFRALSWSFTCFGGDGACH